MAVIKPFKGIRYDTAVAGDISQLCCPPYDIISDEQRMNFIMQNPQNVIRLELPREGADIYATAGDILDMWRKNGVLLVEDKPAIQIGHAVWVKKNCIPLRDGKTCGNCASKCPVGAIQMVPLDKSYKLNEEGKWVDAEGRPVKEREILRIPVVDTEICIGCGACENLCPARPFSAIYVEGHEVHRNI